ncbi:MAG TPA: hypothetical protein VMB82_09420 [Acidimicrobiales bacterium]|nr:hypothetical protein [Acidimicrobiales bacterium]
MAAAVLTVAASGQPAGAAGSTASPSSRVRTVGSGRVSPKAVLTASLDAAQAQGSVHYVATSAVGDKSVRVTGDTATATASQAVVLHVGKGTGHVTGRLVDGAVYLRGDTLGLEDYLGMPSTLAPKYVGQWISFPSSTKSYSTIAKSMSLTSAIDQISVEAPLSGGQRTTRGGRSAVSIKGTTTSLSSTGNKGTAILYVSATGSPLPLAYHGTGTQEKKSETGTVIYSKWGETVKPKVPAKSVPSSSITG